MITPDPQVKTVVETDLAAPVMPSEQVTKQTSVYVYPALEAIENADRFRVLESFPAVWGSLLADKLDLTRHSTLSAALQESLRRGVRYRLSLQRYRTAAHSRSNHLRHINKLHRIEWDLEANRQSWIQIHDHTVGILEARLKQEQTDLWEYIRIANTAFRRTFTVYLLTVYTVMRFCLRPVERLLELLWQILAVALAAERKNTLLERTITTTLAAEEEQNASPTTGDHDGKIISAATKGQKGGGKSGSGMKRQGSGKETTTMVRTTKTRAISAARRNRIEIFDRHLSPHSQCSSSLRNCMQYLRLN